MCLLATIPAICNKTIILHSEAVVAVVEVGYLFEGKVCLSHRGRVAYRARLAEGLNAVTEGIMIVAIA